MAKLQVKKGWHRNGRSKAETVAFRLCLLTCAMTVCHAATAAFVTTHYRFNRTVENLDDVWSCMADPSSWAAKPVTKTYGTFSFESIPSSGGRHSDFAALPLPGFQRRTDHCDNMAVQAHAIVNIPTAGRWSFDCGHDDGFFVTISGCGQVYSFQDDRNTEYTHTTRVYDIAVPGTYTISILGYEVGAGMICDLSVAKGEHRRFDARVFRLMGTSESEVVFSMDSNEGGGETPCRASSATPRQRVGDFWSTVPLSTRDGYTWSMTSRIGDLLKEAEKLFGARDREWTILGAEYRADEGAVPQNWYPGYPERKQIIFQVVGRAADDRAEALYQLSHEVVHALSPHVGKTATVLEEGVASWFSERCTKNATGVDVHSTLASYRRARDLVAGILDKDEKAIRRLRAVEPSFDKITEKTFKAAAVNVDSATISELLSTFVRE